MTRDDRPEVDYLPTDGGGLERPFPMAELSVYERVDLNEDRLLFRGSSRRVVPGDRLLLNFADLHTRSHEAIRRYATKWGPLGLCHWHPTKPFSHRCDDGWMKLPPTVGGEAVDEPLEAWIAASIEVYDLLALANRLHRPEPRTRPALSPDERRREFDDLQQLNSAVNRWLSDGGVSVGLCWWSLDDSPTVRLEGHRLYGALAAQLLMAASRSSGAEVCDGCGGFYIPPRRPRVDERHYCGKPECGGYWDSGDQTGAESRRGPWRDAQRRKREGLARPRRKQGESDEALQERIRAFEARVGVSSRQ